MNGMTLADWKEEGFSGDAASLFTLVKFKKDGLEKVELVKLGWGEFSKNVFKKGAKSLYSDSIPERRGEKNFYYKALYDILRSLPFDVYCVRQMDSYLANKSTQKDMFFILKNISKNTLDLSQKAVKL